MPLTPPPLAETCCTPGTTPVAPEAPSLEIVCTLGGADFRNRLSGIRDLAGRGLLDHERKPLRLHLTYDRALQAELQAIVDDESDCCRFLDFALTDDGVVIHLTITAPEAAAVAAEEIFDHFAPGSRRS
ncbi:hypothetical protein JJJ17_07500 [Paracoccus caeni]|uniref:Uncharacterized protein n=1 Tax=Paracoccus caeni TaxID=657651 RepID=A0A934SBB4_9RHOB|nr:hypothetical protein [Paracoccus caeni]MBK4215765.1 hypothetical protein [Paracoccus caeni]